MNNQELWQEYLSTLPEKHVYKNLGQPTHFSFGDNPRLADELLTLVLSGTKTATCGALWWYEAESIPMPKVSELFIVQDGLGLARCLVETIEVSIQIFEEVNEDFASAEGEGARTLQAWREGHERYFKRTLPEIGREFEPRMPLVCERFKLLYKIA